MDGIINVRVNGYSISKDSNCAGAQYEANSTKLRIEFSDDWKGFDIRVTFWNALGGNPTKINLGEDKLEDKTKNELVYIVPIPPEAMTEVGMLSFTINGIDAKTEPNTIKRSVEDKLKVLPSRKDDNAGNSIAPTPSDVEQFRNELAHIRDGLADAATAEVNAEASAAAAKLSENAAKESEVNAEEYRDVAEAAKNKAEAAVGKTSYIGDNGNWFAWDSEAGDNGAFVDTGVRAQSGSIVYVGKEPPEEADIWLDPDGDTRKYVERKYIDLRSYWNETNPKFYMECSEVNFAVGDGIGETVYWLLVPSVFGVEQLSGDDYYVIHPLKVMCEGNASGVVVVTQTLDGQERHWEFFPGSGGYWSEWTPVEDDVTNVKAAIAEHNGSISTHKTLIENYLDYRYATPAYVAQEITKVNTGGSVDLNGYATEAFVEGKIDDHIEAHNTSGLSHFAEFDYKADKTLFNVDNAYFKDKAEAAGMASADLSNVDPESVPTQVNFQRLAEAAGVGGGTADLTDYAKLTDVDEKIAEYNEAVGEELAKVFATKEELEANKEVVVGAVGDLLENYPSETEMNRAIDDAIAKAGGGSSVEVVNNLTTISTTKALSAYQGYLLNQAIAEKGIPVVNLTGDGIDYTGTIEGLNGFKNGMMIVAIPDTTNIMTPIIKINGTPSSLKVVAPEGNYFPDVAANMFRAGVPYLLMYSGEGWLLASKTTIAPSEISGTIGVYKGGTGTTTFPKGSYLVGNNGSAIQSKAPAEVYADIMAASVINLVGTVTNVDGVKNNETINGKTTIGQYYVKYGVANMPSSAILTVLLGNGCYYQKIEFYDGSTYRRNNASGSWSDWTSA